MIITRIGRSWLLLAALVTVTAGCDDDGVVAPTPDDPPQLASVTLVPSKTFYSVGESVVNDVLIVNGMNVHTVAKGRKELLEEDLDLDRIRRPGGGRKPIKKKRRR